MPKSLKITFLLTFFIHILKGQNSYQNLVINPSFEQRIVKVLPRTEDPIDSIEEFVGWSSPTGFRAMVYTTDESGFVIDIARGQRDFKAKTGKNVAALDPYGMKTNVEQTRAYDHRSYLQGELSEPLTVGQKYYVGFSNHYHCLATNSIGIAFALSETVKDTSPRLRLQPVAVQKNVLNYDEKNIWSFVLDSFIADKAYKNVYIGNFFRNDSTAIGGSVTFGHYIAYVDDVFVLKAKNPFMQPKKIVPKPVVANPILPLPKVLNRVQFRINSTDFEPESYAQLDSAALTLTNFPKLKILIKGHTSSEGNADHNQRLSERRAEAVKDYLTKKGIAAYRLTSKGLGASQPISGENSEENRRLNRRIEFEIMSE
jgi:outer membrane protein OmpA-like peptidoglycan-associated protein